MRSRHPSRTGAAPALIAAVSTLVLTGCGAEGQATVGGKHSGLNVGQALTLQNNGADNLTATINGRFAVASLPNAGSVFNLCVLSQPLG